MRLEGKQLVTDDGKHRYNIDANNIPLFAETLDNAASKAQQAHYDGMADEYARNLALPHTQAYQGYLDQALLADIGVADLGLVGEYCCGVGEAQCLLRERAKTIIALDISHNMLIKTSNKLDYTRHIIAQADVTKLPLLDHSVDNVIILGGIHHVNDRDKLFSEVYRTLKPGGRFIFREPVSDFLPWKVLRTIIYRLSPALEYETESPLRYEDTVPLLCETGFRLSSWKTYGFFGFCLFMNSDVLIFNRLFRFIPGIRKVVRFAAKLDHLITSLTWLSKKGLIVVGIATKPHGTPLRQPLVPQCDKGN